MRISYLLVGASATLLLLLAGCGTEEASWGKAQRLHSSAGYEDFLRRHPTSCFAGQASDSLQTIEYAAVRRAPTICSLLAFRKRFPESRFLGAVTATIDSTYPYAFDTAFGRGYSEEARSILECLVVARPEDPLALNNLGCCYRAMYAEHPESTGYLSRSAELLARAEELAGSIVVADVLRAGVVTNRSNGAMRRFALVARPLPGEGTLALKDIVYDNRRFIDNDRR